MGSGKGEGGGRGQGLTGRPSRESHLALALVLHVKMVSIQQIWTYCGGETVKITSRVAARRGAGIV